MRTIHRLILLLLLLVVLRATAANLPERSVVLPGIDETAFMARLDTTDVQPLEGVWYYPNEQMTIGIERWHGESNIAFRLILLSSNDFELLPGTVMGYMAESAVDDKLQLWLYSQRRGITLHDPLVCVATVNGESNVITFDPPKWKVKVRVNFARFLPTLFRGITLQPEYREEKLPIGFKKIYPNAQGDAGHNRVRYL